MKSTQTVLRLNELLGAPRISGVAIAVALMPPLCVAGYGLGVAFSVDAGEGLRVARGGGLLFLTNLVAIMFTAMLVFLLLHVDTPGVRKRVREWREQHQTSRRLRGWLRRLPGYERLRVIGGKLRQRRCFAPFRAKSKLTRLVHSVNKTRCF